MIKNLENKILFGITGEKEKDWKAKLKEINKFGLEEAALFLEMFDQKQRKKIYRALLDTGLKNIPLCHIRNDMEIEELVFLESKFKTEYFTIHENSFTFLHKWKGFLKKLYLEMNWNDSVPPGVAVEDIGGFCVDFSHFKAAMVEQTKDFDYVLEKRKTAEFACNHLNGYDEEKNSDVHYVSSSGQFDYLRDLPEFLFGKVIAIEAFNSIQEQMKFKEYILKLLKS